MSIIFFRTMSSVRSNAAGGENIFMMILQFLEIFVGSMSTGLHHCWRYTFQCACRYMYWKFTRLCHDHMYSVTNFGPCNLNVLVISNRNSTNNIFQYTKFIFIPFLGAQFIAPLGIDYPYSVTQLDPYNTNIVSSLDYQTNSTNNQTLHIFLCLLTIDSFFIV